MQVKKEKWVLKVAILQKLSFLFILNPFYLHMNWDSWDESDKFLSLNDSDTNKPVLILARGCECPLQELSRVVETEHIILIFHVILN